jgi:DNA helicase-4
MNNFFTKIFSHSPNLSPLYPEIRAALADYDKLLLAYINHSKVQHWKNTYAHIAENIAQSGYGKGLLAKNDELISLFLQRYEHIDTMRHLHNHTFVENELQQNWACFADIDGKFKLDAQQKKAIVTDEDNNLVIASAGGGKTTVLIAKVRYLLEQCGVEPQDILLIADNYNRKERLDESLKQIPTWQGESITFHRLGLHIIEQATRKSANIAKDKNYSFYIEDVLEHLKKDPQYARLLVNYFAFYLSEYRPEAEFDSRGEYILHFKNQHLLLKKDKANGQREILKSMETVEIANFLFLHHIEYQYKAPYQYAITAPNKQPYKPDFYLPQYGIYIEHFVLDEADNCPEWFKPSYHEGKAYTYQDYVKWVRQLHQKHHTNLIETLSYQKQQGTLLQQLAEKLRLHGVDLSQVRSAVSVLETIKQQDEYTVIRFYDLLYVFLLTLKSNNLSLEQVKERNRQLNHYEHERNKIFLRLFEPIYQAYTKRLADKGEIDFNDAISHALEYVRNGQYKNPYKYLLIDEFQDMTGARADLIKALKASNPPCKLFCAGDDWQSIYRFAGSDLSLFTDFEAHFGITARLLIETTYRFDETLIELSNRFVMKNPFQMGKKVRSCQPKKPLEKAYQVVYSADVPQTVAQILAEIVAKNAQNLQHTPNDLSVMLVLRTLLDNREWEQIKADKRHFAYDPIAEQNLTKLLPLVYKPCPALKIVMTTAHGAKGLQADYAIIINCSDGKFDFPSQIDDAVMQLLLCKAEHYPYAEERRLFYVAMTRARKKVYLVSNRDYPSVFIREIDQYEPTKKIDPLLCPHCQTGRIVQRQAAGKIFYGCSLYPYCEQTMSADYYARFVGK